MKKLAIAASIALVLGPLPAAAGLNDIHDEGVGMYTDLSVVNQLSTFTINSQMVSCGVGTVALGQLTGPFAMLMYSKHITSYDVNRTNSTITAKGKMRSITRVAGLTVEDVEHDFTGIAVDDTSGSPDRFDIHFKTAFWNALNPMCTPSSVVALGCRFGGNVIMGEVVVD